MSYETWKAGPMNFDDSPGRTYEEMDADMDRVCMEHALLQHVVQGTPDSEIPAGLLRFRDTLNQGEGP